MISLIIFWVAMFILFFLVFATAVNIFVPKNRSMATNPHYIPDLATVVVMLLAALVARYLGM